MFSITSEAFKKIALVELQYRKLAEDLQLIYNDIRNTALCLATRGALGHGDFKDVAKWSKETELSTL